MNEMSSINKINSLTRQIEEVTGETHNNLTEAIQTLKDGYGQGGGILVQEQTDWNQADINAPSFLRNKPFGEGLVTIDYFSKEKAPNPVSFNEELLGITAYKISDIIFSEDQLEEGFYFTIEKNDASIIIENSLSGYIISIGDSVNLINLPSGYQFLVAGKSGEIDLEPPYAGSINIEKEGTYVVFQYGESLPEGLTIEISQTGIKQIDEKYIPYINWDKIKDKPDILPPVTAADAGKILSVNSEGKWVVIDLPT